MSRYLHKYCNSYALQKTTQPLGHIVHIWLFYMILTFKVLFLKDVRLNIASSTFNLFLHIWSHYSFYRMPYWDILCWNGLHHFYLFYSLIQLNKHVNEWLTTNNKYSYEANSNHYPLFLHTFIPAYVTNTSTGLKRL